jgi:cell division protein FtsB
VRVLTLIFVILIASLQYPLWLGKGSWLRVWDLNRQITEQKDRNKVLKARNDTLDAEVRDLKQGYAAIEERARSELGMVKSDEVFYQVLQPDTPAAYPAPPVDPAQKQSMQQPSEQQGDTNISKASPSDTGAAKPIIQPTNQSTKAPRTP